MSLEKLQQSLVMLDTNVRAMNSEKNTLTNTNRNLTERLKEYKSALNKTKQLPYMVSNVSEIIDMENDTEESDLTTADRDAIKNQQSVVVKTSMR